MKLSRLILLLICLAFILIYIPFNSGELQTLFNDSSVLKEFSSSGNWSYVDYFRIPKYSNVLNASINISNTSTADSIINFINTTSVHSEGLNATACFDTSASFDATNPPNNLPPSCDSSSISDLTLDYGLDVLDGTYATTNNGVEEDFVYFEFNISSVNLNDIAKINISIYATKSDATSSQRRLYLFNVTAQDWVQVSFFSAINTLNNSNGAITAGFSDFINQTAKGNLIHVLYVDNEANSMTTSIDYAEVRTSYNSSVNSVVLDIGNDGDAEFNHSGVLNSQNKSDFTIELQNYLTTCTAIAGFCDIPFNISAREGGVILSALTINYTETPRISITAPANNSNQTSISINYTVADTNLNTCFFTTNKGVTNSSRICGFNITVGIANGKHINLTIYANDTSGNTNQSSLTFTLDNVAPVLTVDKPAISEEFSSNYSVPLNYTVTDATIGVANCWYNLDGTTNKTLTNCQNTTFNTTDGAHTLYFYTNDSLGNLASLSRSFTISLDAPAITLDKPTNNTFWNNGTNFYLNYTATDANGIDYCQVWHNLNGSFALNQTNNGVSSGKQNYTTFNISDGTFMWNVFCIDTTASGKFSAINATFTIDQIAPIVTIPPIITTQGSQTIEFNHSVTDTNVQSCKYSIYNSSNSIDGLNSNITVVCNTNQTSATVTSYGTYTLRVYANDTVGHEAYTDRAFTTSEGNGTVVIGGGGGSTTTIIVGATLATNFSITSTNLDNTLDLVLAKGSVKSREKSFVLTNKALEPFTITLECALAENSTLNFCDYVSFEQTTIEVSASEDVLTSAKVFVLVPENASFGDIYTFNVLAYKDKNTDNPTFSKLSVTARVPIWALVYKQAYIPFQAKDKAEKATYPVFWVALLAAFILFSIIVFVLRRKFLVTGFILALSLGAIAFSALLYFL
ncbi:hypothetical protein M0R04_09810 [Candidatus Dojkabacteria bacterium]|jgi:hypothetical protein|nr:hypothetical protein [Candidatus Dojkabacteria bacterium]